MKEIIEMLEKLIKDGESILNGGSRNLTANWAKSERWENRCKDLLAQYVSSDEAEEFDKQSGEMNYLDPEGSFIRHVEAKMAFFNELKEDVANNPDFWKDKLIRAERAADKSDKDQPISVVTKICERFHLVVRQLSHRYDNRKPLEVRDEYDVQDLMHALLQIFFDDIRREQWTPSYAGSSARMDFLLNNESLAIETKKTRNGLTPKKLGDELIVDI